MKTARIWIGFGHEIFVSKHLQQHHSLYIGESPVSGNTLIRILHVLYNTWTAFQTSTVAQQGELYSEFRQTLSVTLESAGGRWRRAAKILKFHAFPSRILCGIDARREGTLWQWYVCSQLES